MSSLVYFKFKANVKTDSIPFDGSSISVKDLKNAIRTKCCLYSSDFDLKLEDASGKAYNKDDELIPKYSSIVVRRVPKLNTDAQKKKPAPEELPWRGSMKNVVASNAQVTKHVNLADADLSEEEKIKIMMERSSEAYSEKNFAVKPKPYGVPPAAYICHKCGLPGHWIHNCPGVRDKTGKMMDVKSVKRPTGIPQDFLLEVEAGTPGAYLEKSGRYMVPIKDAEAYALGKKDKRPFSVEENPPYIQSERRPPKQFICPLCNEMFRDAVLVSCCGTTYCNDCILGHVFDSQVLGSHACPNCGASLTDHESSVFENALVRSMIRDWLANENPIPESDANFSQEDALNFDISEKTFVNNRRVLKPKQALTATQGKQSITESHSSDVSTETKSEENKSKSSPSPISCSDSVALSAAPISSVDSENVELNVEDTHSPIVQSNTCTTVVASSPCTTFVGSSRQPLLVSTSGLSNSRFPCISYPVSTTVVPTILPSIGGSNPLLNALYNMHVENLQQSVAVQQALPLPFQGPLLGGPDWASGSALAASVSQTTGLVDPLLQLASNQPAYGLGTGQPISGNLAPVPLQTLDGHKVLSKEEFYRLKMEMLHSARIRHRRRSRSRSRSPARTYRRPVLDDHESISRRHARSSWERKAHRRSSEREDDDYRHRYDRIHYQDSKYDRIRMSRHRYRSGEPDHVDSEPERSHFVERRYVRDKNARDRNEGRYLSREGRPIRNRSRSDSRSPQRRPCREANEHCRKLDTETKILGNVDASRTSASPLPVSVVPQYEETSEAESSGSRPVPRDNGLEAFSHSPFKRDHEATPLSPSLVDQSEATKTSGLIASAKLLTRENGPEKIKKEKKHKKHKHKHRSEKKKEKHSRLMQMFDASTGLWTLGNSENLDNAQDESLVLKKHKKHKKHKHEDKAKKKSRKEKKQRVVDTPASF